MPYSLESMQIIEQERSRKIWDSRLPATASLIIAGGLLLLTPSYAAAQAGALSTSQNRNTWGHNNTRRTSIVGFVHNDDVRHTLALAQRSSFC
jgi:hypothetical protein